MAQQDQDDTAALNSGTLIAGSYSVDFFKPLPQFGAGLEAFAVRSLPGDTRRLMALQIPAHLPPLRPPTLSPSAPIPNLLTPVAFGAVRGPDRRMAQMVVGYSPAGLALSETALPSPGKIASWPEEELLRHVLAPSAEALEQLHGSGSTHRAVRINNIFRAGNAGPITLGAFWSSAPASLQPAIYEAPSVAMCHPAARGAGTAADDVYALGVSLLILAAGRMPMPALSDADVIARKLELGSFAALTADIRVTPALANILRGMLADDPDQRPEMGSLTNPTAAKARKVAPRPHSRAKKPLALAQFAIWNPQTAAFALFREPKAALEPLRAGIVDRWIRQMFGDHVMAARIEELVRRNAEGGHAGGDAEFIARVICLLDPLAPLCWRGLALWPEGIGSLLSSRTEAGIASRLDEIVEQEMVAIWAAGRPERCDAIALKLDARRLRTMFRMPGWSGGRARLRYALGPVNSLSSPLVDGHAVTELADLLPALEAKEECNPGPALTIDREICAFIVARDYSQADQSMVTLAAAKSPAAAVMATLHILAGLQATYADASRFPKLCAALARNSPAIIETWRNRSRRKKISDSLGEIADAGHIPSLAALLDDDALRERDETEALRANAYVARIDAELAAIAAESPRHSETARRIGAGLAIAVSAASLFATIVALVVA